MDSKLYEPTLATGQFFLGILSISMVSLALLSQLQDYNMALVFMLPLCVLTGSALIGVISHEK